MAQLTDYLEWRGDISFANVGPTEADYCIMACISYLPYDGLVPENPEEQPVDASKVFSKILKLCGPKGDGREYHTEHDEELVNKLLDSPRYSRLGFTAFENIFDEEKEMQFAAITLLLPMNEAVVIFRGTDKTLIGWKEDFNMGFNEIVPSQARAVEYLENVARVLKRKLYVCGHSKGGNLALYSSAFCSDETRQKIKEVVNLDGPGFSLEKSVSPEFNRVVDRMRTYMPQGSIVGILLEHAERNTIIHSNGSMFGQHSPYTWEIRRADFVREEGLTPFSRNVDATMKEWVAAMSTEKREKLVEGYWTVFSGLGVRKLEEIFTLKNAISVVRAISGIDEETKDLLNESIRVFKNSYKRIKQESKNSDQIENDNQLYLSDGMGKQ